MAGLLSFLVPGLGQLCTGRLFSGLMWFVLLLIAYVVAGMTLGVGLIIAVPLHLMCIVSAYQGAEKQREKSMERAIRRAQGR